MTWKQEKTRNRLDFYVQQLKEKGYEAVGILGFNGQVKRNCTDRKRNKCDMLVIGAHGHTRYQRSVYGETIDSVRHELKIPVLVVNV